jgi:bifunctional DNA-binding transcriptional regulator/antitoxin component of YhaV-PrlF toxin-antitoxin module
MRKQQDEAFPKPRIIDTQNRVLLPPEVLEALGAGPGDYVSFQVDGPRASIYKVRWLPEK